MYNKVSTNMNFVEREKEIEKFWRDNDIFKKSMENRGNHGNRSDDPSSCEFSV